MGLGLLGLVLALASLSFATQKKALVIILGGIRADCMELTSTPHLDALADGDGYKDLTHHNSNYPYKASVNYASLFTGVSQSTHGVGDEDDFFHNIDEYDSLPQILSNADADADVKSALYHVKPDASKYVLGTTIVEKSDTDEACVSKALQGIVLDTHLDLAIVLLEGADSVGHSQGGFMCSSKRYIARLVELDNLVGRFTSALENRTTIAGEDHDWLVIVSSDHGGNYAAHEGMSDAERRRWVFANLPVPDYISAQLPETAPANDTYALAPAYAPNFVTRLVLDHFGVPAPSNFAPVVWVDHARANTNYTDGTTKTDDWTDAFHRAFWWASHPSWFWQLMDILITLALVVVAALVFIAGCAVPGWLSFFERRASLGLWTHKPILDGVDAAEEAEDAERLRRHKLASPESDEEEEEEEEEEGESAPELPVVEPTPVELPTVDNWRTHLPPLGPYYAKALRAEAEEKAIASTDELYEVLDFLRRPESAVVVDPEISAADSPLPEDEEASAAPAAARLLPIGSEASDAGADADEGEDDAEDAPLRTRRLGHRASTYLAKPLRAHTVGELDARMGAIRADVTDSLLDE